MPSVLFVKAELENPEHNHLRSQHCIILVAISDWKLYSKWSKMIFLFQEFRMSTWQSRMKVEWPWLCLGLSDFRNYPFHLLFCFTNPFSAFYF